MRRKLFREIGIWYTAYTLTIHRDGSITVKAPYIKYQNNDFDEQGRYEGVLAFKKKRFTGGLARQIKEAFAADTVNLSGYACATISDAVMGYLG